MMKRLVILIVVLLFSTTTFAQTRSRTTSRRGTSKTAKPAATAPANQAKLDGANKVADQVKTLTRFLYVIGGVAKGIEDIDDAAKSNQALPAALQKIDQNKAV